VHRGERPHPAAEAAEEKWGHTCNRTPVIRSDYSENRDARQYGSRYAQDILIIMPISHIRPPDRIRYKVVRLSPKVSADLRIPVDFGQGSLSLESLTVTPLTKLKIRY